MEKADIETIPIKKTFDLKLERQTKTRVPPGLADAVSYLDLIKQIENYFIRCREYYFEVCESMNWNSSIISHLHPHIAISSQLNLPKNFKSLAMELDVEADMFCAGLQDLKSNNGKSIDEIELKFEQMDDLFANMSVSLSDDKVSYRKIFFENNEDEIRKMYDFFDNEDYFDKNRVQIVSEFRQYHKDNMRLVEEMAPKLYEQINLIKNYSV